ncbi:hypothetical protein OG698_30885 [Streptomyces sp. NBC_01003]|uniref:hypothetical protein n=1 Tax=Streptomyces sp. NBC_01003 TaxID=2903714 RepID=UPI00386B8198|nr:hypothetical protein OG698_30885 [Streptomyces sp. NBC_01003]
MSKRSIAVTAAIAGAAALAATGINYAAAAGTEAAPAAPAVRQAAAPAAAPLGGDSGQGKEKEDNNYGGGYKHEGRIHFNERSYSAWSDGCITVVSGLGSRSFNVRNDSRKTVEVFRGATCDNGSPIATVGPWSTSNSIVPFRHIRGGVFVKNGVVGSFRVVDDHRGGYGGGYGGGKGGY